jgi:dTDP-4-dehydrorhamnose 3,5-epimerase
MGADVDVQELTVPDSFVFTPRQHHDERGVFLEYFKSDVFAKALGHRLDLAQANCSVSSRGTLRGIHFADVPPGQAKYVTCVRGAGLDVVVDIRVGSPTFGQWDAVRLDEQDRRAVYLAEGLGHAFLALTDDATLLYLCSTGYHPDREHGISPLDPELAIRWPDDVTPLLSAKDEQAPTLNEALAAGQLPDYEACRRWYGQLRRLVV